MLRSVTWTDESIDHIARHGVGPREVEDVLYSRPRYVQSGRAGTREVFGQTGGGRYLLVVTTGAQDGGTYVVTARDMTDPERRAFRRKGR